MSFSAETFGRTLLQSLIDSKMVSGRWSQGGEAGQEGVIDEEEAIRLSLTPNLHAHMLRSHRRRTCCPLLFERAASSWWNPK